MLYGAYRSITSVAGLILPRWLAYRAGRGKEETARLGERQGVTSQPRPAGRLVWFHAASVGESLSILPLIEAATTRGWGVLITTGTLTSARLMAERMPAGAIHQYIPLDYLPWVRRFLDHWRPDLVLWTESELWPNTLTEISGRKISLVLVNARLSDRAFRGWRRWPGFARQVLSTFNLVIAQSHEDGLRFKALNATSVAEAGNLKLAADPLPADEVALTTLQNESGKRPRWLAASIHPGEDAIVAHVHQTIKPRHPGLLTIVVPRHPQKAVDMAAVFINAGLKVARRSACEPLTPATDIYIADTMGELGLFYRLCDLAFMGKSLAVGGGQNPAEAAQLGCALLLGADMGNFRETTAELLSREAAVEVRNGEALTAAVDWLLKDTRTRQRLSQNARGVMARHANAVNETLSHLDPYLAPLS
jgi:3-deoxy-D-manno-octulosonic-acid transferase